MRCPVGLLEIFVQPASMVQVFSTWTMRFMKAPSSLPVAQVENTGTIHGSFERTMINPLKLKY